MLKIIDTISGFLDAFVSWRHFAPVMGLLACALPTLLLAIQLIMYVAYQPSLGFIRHSKKFVAKYGYVDQYVPWCPKYLPLRDLYGCLWFRAWDCACTSHSAQCSRTC